jgi:protein TonB
MPKPEAKAIHPRTSPIQSQSDTQSLHEIPSARIPKQYTSPKTEEAYLATLPREFPSATRQEPEVDSINLGNLRGLFTGKVRQRIATAKNYPRIARRRRMEGQPVIAFTLDKGGRVMQAALARTSGYRLLDQAALEAVHQAAPYPEIPAPLKMDTFQFKLPISFNLK